jgi:toxin-antitoxin system PIN domain toxin
MIIPDVNLLLYAYDSNSPFHAKASAWWQRSLSGSEPIGIPGVIIFAFMRLGTSARIFQNPMTVSEAAGHIRSWLKQPQVQVLEPGTKHIEQTLQLLEHIGTGGNLVTNAQIAALAIEYEAVLHTTDTDFMRFPNLRWRNPLTGGAGRSRS